MSNKYLVHLSWTFWPFGFSVVSNILCSNLFQNIVQGKGEREEGGWMMVEGTGMKADA